MSEKVNFLDSTPIILVEDPPHHFRAAGAVELRLRDELREKAREALGLRDMLGMAHGQRDTNLDRAEQAESLVSSLRAEFDRLQKGTHTMCLCDWSNPDHAKGIVDFALGLVVEAGKAIAALRAQMGDSWNCHECGGNHPWPAGPCPSKGKECVCHPKDCDCAAFKGLSVRKGTACGYKGIRGLVKGCPQCDAQPAASENP